MMPAPSGDVTRISPHPAPQKGERMAVPAPGFREEAFDTSRDGFMSVGAHRLAGEPAALVLGQRLFTFPQAELS
jgi:hypothetical protein